MVELPSDHLSYDDCYNAHFAQNKKKVTSLLLKNDPIIFGKLKCYFYLYGFCQTKRKYQPHWKIGKTSQPNYQQIQK